MEHQVELPDDGEFVSFTTTFTSPGWDRPQTSRSTLRFLDAGPLAGFLAGAGLDITEQYGDWAGSRWPRPARRSSRSRRARPGRRSGSGGRAEL